MPARTWEWYRPGWSPRHRSRAAGVDPRRKPIGLDDVLYRSLEEVVANPAEGIEIELRPKVVEDLVGGGVEVLLA